MTLQESAVCGGLLEAYDTNTLFPICTASKEDVNECKINAHIDNSV